MLWPLTAMILDFTFSTWELIQTYTSDTIRSIQILHEDMDTGEDGSVVLLGWSTDSLEASCMQLVYFFFFLNVRPIEMGHKKCGVFGWELKRAKLAFLGWEGWHTLSAVNCSITSQPWPFVSSCVAKWANSSFYQACYTMHVALHV